MYVYAYLLYLPNMIYIYIFVPNMDFDVMMTLKGGFEEPLAKH